MLQHFLTAGDEYRAVRIFEKLARHDLGPWVLTGGFATEIHHMLLGATPCQRVLTDIDFLVDRFDDIPETLAHDFFFRHVHPFDPPNKTLLQAIDVQQATRIDVFRACGGTIIRSLPLNLAGSTVRLISREDLVARQARLAMDLIDGVPVPFKYARDFLRLLRLTDIGAAEHAWRDHRKPNHPATFREASSLLQEAIASHRDLLNNPAFSQDVTATCARCHATPGFRLADPKNILATLGYC